MGHIWLFCTNGSAKMLSALLNTPRTVFILVQNEMIPIKFCFYEETDGGPANIETTLDRLVSFNSTASLLEILDLKYFSSS